MTDKEQMTEEEQYRGQLAFGKGLLDAMEGHIDEEALSKFTQLLVPPSMQDLNAEQMREHHVQQHLRNIKTQMLACDNGKLVYGIPWEPTSAMASLLCNKLVADGFDVGIAGDNCTIEW